jgi:hypothetical protein
VSTTPGRRGIAAAVLARNGMHDEAGRVLYDLEALPAGTWTKASGLAIGYMGMAIAAWRFFRLDAATMSAPRVGEAVRDDR